VKRFLAQGAGCLLSLVVLAIFMTLVAVYGYFFLPRVHSGPDEGSAVPLTDAQWNSSRAATVFECWTGATSTHRIEDAATFAKAIGSFERMDESAQEQHDRYLQGAVVRWAKLSPADQKTYYAQMCAEPVVTLRRAIDQGMIR
jgi:hypothetical protein